MRDRLIELLLKSEPLHERDLDDDLAEGEVEAIADHLFANGVIVPPVKVGQTVYTIHGKMGIVTSIHQNLVGNEVGRWVITAWFDNYYADSKEAGFECGTHKVFYFDDFGKTVFLTREEAEKALKGESE